MPDNDNPFPTDLATDAVPIELSDDKIDPVRAAIQAANGNLTADQTNALVVALQQRAKEGDLAGIIKIVTDLAKGVVEIAKA